MLKPSRDLAPDEQNLETAVRALGGRIRCAARRLRRDRWSFRRRAGIVSRLDDSFRRTITLDGVSVDVRMESWLDFDTIRRMGFGHVIAGREHTLIIERGVSFVAFDATGRAVHTAYAASIFAPQPRFVVRPFR